MTVEKTFSLEVEWVEDGDGQIEVVVVEVNGRRFEGLSLRNVLTDAMEEMEQEISRSRRR